MKMTLALGVTAAARAGTCGMHAYVGQASKQERDVAPCAISRHQRVNTVGKKERYSAAARGPAAPRPNMPPKK
jgi:hypothetical protein